MTPRIRLYGYLTGEASFSQVTRGMRRALQAAGELAGFVPIDVDDDATDGTLAPVSLNIGDPTALLRAHRSGEHRAHWLLLAPNGETLPYGFMKNLLATSPVLPRGMLTGGLLAPSGWAASVLRRYTPRELPVIVAPHGVMPEVHVPSPALRADARARYRRERFDVLHMTSSETERKCTRLLLAAWGVAKKTGILPPLAKLHVVMNPAHMSKIRWWCGDLGLTEEDVTAIPGLTQSQTGITALYGMMHAVCQPSRGEGFGIVPLEALACGVPVLVTACTGHSEYLSDGHPGVFFVEHGPAAPMDDFPGSMAPSVTVDAIKSGLVRLHANWEKGATMAEKNADTVRAEWAWEKKNAIPIRQMLQSEGERQ